MKYWGMLLLLVNHLIAPGFPILIYLLGGIERHLLVMSFLDESRFRSDGYVVHCIKLSFYFVLTGLVLLPFCYWVDNFSVCGVLSVWFCLIWLRPLLFRYKYWFLSFGVGISIFTHFYLFSYGTIFLELGSLNLFGFGLAYPGILKLLAIRKIPFWYWVLIYPLFLIISGFYLFTYPGLQLDFLPLGFCVILLSFCFSHLLVKVKPLPFVSKHSLSFYAFSLYMMYWLYY